jgi:hypothetical protein
MKHTQDPTQLFHDALTAIVEGNLPLAHDYAIAAARIYQQQGSEASAKLAFEIAQDPEQYLKAS